MPRQKLGLPVEPKGFGQNEGMKMKKSGNACFDMVACGNGVIEGGKLEGAVDGLQANACQNGGCRTSVDQGQPITCTPYFLAA